MDKFVLRFGLVIGAAYTIIMVILALLKIIPIGSILGIYGICILMEGLFIFMLWELFKN